MSKTIGTVGALALGIATLAGCSSSSGGGGGGGSAPDFAALRAQYASPTGSLQSSDVLGVGKQLATSESQTSSVPTAPASSSIHVVPALRPRTQDTPISCSPVGSSGEVSCACDVSGTFTGTFSPSGQAGDEEGSFDYDDCVLDESTGTSSGTETINGTMSFAYYTTPPAMDLYQGSLTVTLTPPGTTATESFDFALVDGQITYSVTIASGTVLVSDTGEWDESTESGSFTVTDRSGTWSCTVTSGHGSCTGPGGSLSF